MTSPKHEPAGPLAGVRVIDLTQLVAGPAATRTLAALGADVIKVEWENRLDNIRFNPPIVLHDDPAEWALVLGGVTGDMVPSENRSGFFNDLNAGKRGLGLNLKDERDREVFTRLVAHSDVVVENFSATAMERLGLGYSRLREWNPAIVYAQASAFGAHGHRSGYSYGPTAEAEAGLTHLSGLPDREPAGWGFAYMDITAGHLMAFSVLAALAQARRTESSVHVDLSQVGSAIFLTGTAVLEHSVTGQPTERWGNDGPPGVPGFQGVYRCGDDEDEHWLAVSVHDEDAWTGLARVLGQHAGTLGEADPEQAHRWVQDWARDQNRYAAMAALQRNGVPAGACQTGRDRVEVDPQLRARGFTRLAHNLEIGWWPVQDVPFRFSRTPAGVGLPGRPASIGHAIPRGAPTYDEDGHTVRKELAGVGEPSPIISKASSRNQHPLAGARVMEIGDGVGEFAGRLLQGAGAEVIKIEPPDGARSRAFGPFAPHGESLYFHQYNLGKRSVVLDLDTAAGRRDLHKLFDTTDVVIDISMPGFLSSLELEADEVSRHWPELVWCSITPFGQWGPWASYRADEFVHLALGGQMMMCGYDPVLIDGVRHYDTPPIAPGRHQVAHTVGSHAATAIVAALLERERSGLGQVIDVSVHESLATGTEMAVPMWTYGGFEVQRQTARHAWPVPLAPTVFRTSDDRYVYVTFVGPSAMWERLRSVLLAHGGNDRIAAPELADMAVRSTAAATAEIAGIIADFCASHEADDIVTWGQGAGLPWGVVRRPEENADDAHWRMRDLFVDLPAPGGEPTATYLASPWVSAEMPWSDPAPAPLIGADTEEILAPLRAEAPGSPPAGSPDGPE